MCPSRGTWSVCGLCFGSLRKQSLWRHGSVLEGEERELSTNQSNISGFLLYWFGFCFLWHVDFIASAIYIRPSMIYNLLSCPLINSVSPGWKVQVCHLCPFASSNSVSFFWIGWPKLPGTGVHCGQWHSDADHFVLFSCHHFNLVFVCVFFPLPQVFITRPIDGNLRNLSPELQCLIWSPLFGGYCKSSFPSWAILCWHRI